MSAAPELTWFLVVSETPSGHALRYVPKLLRPADVNAVAVQLSRYTIVDHVRVVQPHEVPADERARAEAAVASGRLKPEQLDMFGGR